MKTLINFFLNLFKKRPLHPDPEFKLSDSRPMQGRISGAWKKSGPYGDFFTGKFDKEHLLRELAKFDDMHDFTLHVSPVKKYKEVDPDLVVTFVPHRSYND